MSGLVEKNVLNFIGGVSAMYFANTLSNLKWSFLPPQLIKFLRKDLITRQIFLFFLVFISIQLTKGGSDIPLEDKAISSFFLYIFVLIFPKQTLSFALIELFLFVILYGIYYTINNYDITLPDDTKESLNIAMYAVGGILILLILTGNVFYYFKQKKDKNKDFDYLQFFFGDPGVSKPSPVSKSRSSPLPQPRRQRM